MINQTNFFENSETLFINVFHVPNRAPDYISYANEIIPATEVEIMEGDKLYLITDNGGHMIEKTFIGTFENKEGVTCYVCPTDRISSQYWYTEDGVFRQSDHWGKCRHCMWSLDREVEKGVMHIGFSSWKYFREIDPKTYDYGFNN